MRSGANASGGTALAMTRTSPAKSRGSGGTRTSTRNGKAGFQTRPAGNAVNLEDEMLKVSANQMDYAAATSLYSRSLRLLKIASARTKLNEETAPWQKRRGLHRSMSIATSGLRAQAGRMRVISENIANVEFDRTDVGRRSLPPQGADVFIRA